MSYLEGFAATLEFAISRSSNLDSPIVIKKLAFAKSNATIANVVCDHTTTWQNIYNVVEAMIWNKYTYGLRLYNNGVYVPPSSMYIKDEVEVAETIMVQRCTEDTLPETRKEIQSGWGGVPHESWIFPKSEKEVQCLLAAKANLLDTLHNAVETQPVGVIKRLINAKANLESVDNHGNTPLLCCTVFHEDTSIARVLVEAKADIYATNDEGYTALGEAWRHSNKPMEKMFTSLGMTLDRDIH